MNLNSVSSYTTTNTDNYSIASKAAQAADTKETTNATDTAVVYETTKNTEKVNSKANPELVAKLKADAEERTSQLRSLVEKMMLQQGQAVTNADNMWKFLASGDYTVDPETAAQAQADIAEDGYWGVEQTSDRILSFAEALSGGDKDKMAEMLEAFKKGFKQATKAWGKELPDISQKTYDAVLEKFDKYMNPEDTTTSEIPQ